MNNKEALLFFPHKEGDDLDDLWEERLFKQKQFFLTRPPIAKVFRSRLKKLEKQHLAYLALTENTDNIKSIETSDVDYDFSEDIIEAFNRYHELRNSFKHELLKAMDFVSLKKVIESWLQMESKYYSLWENADSLSDDIQVTKSKEPDPMVLLEKLKEMSTRENISLFTDLHSRYKDTDEVIRNEVKRLTLLSKD